MDKSFLLVGAGGVSTVVPIDSSNHRENYKSGLIKISRTDVKDGLEARGMSAKLSRALKEPGITQTSPSDLREDHENYSPPVSAAIKTS